MSFKILYVSATLNEADVLKSIHGIRAVSGRYRLNNLEITPLITGVGSFATVWTMKQWLSVNRKPDLAINGGIAGSYNDEIMVGDVVMPASDCFADSGIEDGENFLTLPEAGLSGQDDFPFTAGHLNADTRYTEPMQWLLKPVKAITVNTATGSRSTKDKLVKKFSPDIESMEGAAFFYTCLRDDIPFLALRAISNIVELRNRKKWNIGLALARLSEKLDEVMVTLE
jgi:futalosine hydrolase